MTIQKLVAGASVADPLASTGAQVAAAVNGLIDSSRTRRAACMGVSFMAQQTQDGPSNFIFRDIGYLTHFFALNGWPWRWDMSSNFAVGGTLTAAVLSDQVPAVLASHAIDPIDTIFAAMGTNDTYATIPYATTVANMDAIITAITSAGIKMVVESIMPRGTDASLFTAKQVTMRLNKWLEDQHLAGRITYVDITQIMADNTTAFGNAIAGQTYDPPTALHPNTKGAKLISRVFDAYFKGKLNPSITYVTQAADVFDAVNNPRGSLFDNPLMLGGTTAPTGYTTSGGTWGATDNVLPNGQTKRVWGVALLNNTTHFIYRDLVRSGSAWQVADRPQVGDKIEGRCRIKVTSATGLRSVRFFIQESDGATNRTYQCLSNSTANELNSMDGTYTYDLKTPVCTIRPYSGSGNVSVFIRCEFITEASGAGGTVSVESFEARKVP
jgi:hypothetical protein